MATREELEARLKKLKKDLKKHEDKVGDIEKEMDELSEAHSACNSARTKVESMLQSVTDTVRSKTQRVSSQRFRQLYFDNVQKVLRGRDVSDAFSLISKASKGASSQYSDLDDELSVEKSKVNSLKQEIRKVKQKLASMEGDEE